MGTKAILITILVWLALTVICSAVGVVALDWLKWHNLAERGIEVEGRVVAKEPQNHMFIRYSYAVGGNTHSGLGSAGRGNPEFEQLSVGDKVKVFYDPDNPKLSILGDAQEQATSITVGVLFLAIVGPLFALIGLHRKGRLPI